MKFADRLRLFQSPTAVSRFADAGGTRLNLGDIEVIAPGRPSTPQPQQPPRPTPEQLRAAIREYHAAVAASVLYAAGHPEDDSLDSPEWIATIEREGCAARALTDLIRRVIPASANPARDWAGDPLPVAAFRFEGLAYILSGLEFQILDLRSMIDLDRP